MDAAEGGSVDTDANVTKPSGPSKDTATESTIKRNIPAENPNHEQEIRSRGLQLRGECLPDISNIAMTYRDAWRIGKQGCLGVRRNLWDPHLFSGTWYFVCDGTDPANFLVLHAHKSGDKWKRISISMWELVEGFWVANKYRVLYQPRNDDGSSTSSSTRTMVIEGFTRDFYEAMIKCIHEGQVRLQLMQIELKELQKQFTSNEAAPCKVGAPRFSRTRVGYSETHVLTASCYTANNEDTQQRSDGNETK
ncbi:uncharacterized protein BXIN_2884 [Babesia sp. Xinjiang]|uniref:uncharacterized protein n=1 Tax=Babesia sp. Xinjiang TaxID=462227 RepID=UPI000A228F51|nr:uncharacterized protein BXIN_2884 [Babesia sp. Xinjiang]ORM39475.1 hypothetical protein BXIN_2884 [Babesia sp. Xinjiang]